MAHTQRIKIMGLMRLTPEYGATSGPYEKGHQSCTNDGQLAGHPLMYGATYPNMMMMIMVMESRKHHACSYFPQTITIKIRVMRHKVLPRANKTACVNDS